MILVGLVIGRWWVVPTAGVTWAALLLYQGTINVGDVPVAFVLAVANAAVGVGAHQIVLWSARHTRERGFGPT
jgi:hypothetical protein